MCCLCDMQRVSLFGVKFKVNGNTAVLLHEKRNNRDKCDYICIYYIINAIYMQFGELQFCSNAISCWFFRAMAKIKDSLSNLGYLTTDDEEEHLPSPVKKLVCVLFLFYFSFILWYRIYLLF